MVCSSSCCNCYSMPLKYIRNYLAITVAPTYQTTLHLCLHASGEMSERKSVKLLAVSIASKLTFQVHAWNKAKMTLIENLITF